MGVAEKGEIYARSLETRLSQLAQAGAQMRQHPRVYFEEWDEPMISAIRWVSELIGIAGGVDVFPELAAGSLAKDRILADSQEVVRRSPDIMLGSWCGKRFRPEQVRARRGWEQVRAVRDNELHEIKSPLILQPGPAALTDGVDAMHRIFARWAQQPRA